MAHWRALLGLAYLAAAAEAAAPFHNSGEPRQPGHPHPTTPRPLNVIPMELTTPVPTTDPHPQVEITITQAPPEIEVDRVYIRPDFGFAKAAAAMRGAARAHQRAVIEAASGSGPPGGLAPTARSSVAFPTGFPTAVPITQPSVAVSTATAAWDMAARAEAEARGTKLDVETMYGIMHRAAQGHAETLERILVHRPPFMTTTFAPTTIAPTTTPLSPAPAPAPAPAPGPSPCSAPGPGPCPGPAPGPAPAAPAPALAMIDASGL